MIDGNVKIVFLHKIHIIAHKKLYGDIGFANIKLPKKPAEFDDISVMLYRPKYFKAVSLDFLKEK
jgi:hypothetical protein